MHPSELIKAQTRFLRITVGNKHCRPSSPLSRNVLRVGECASCSAVWRSRASDWPLHLPICTTRRDLHVVQLGYGSDGACHAGSREESAGAVAAASVLCCCAALVVPVLACSAVYLTRAAGNGGWLIRFKVRCPASQRLLRIKRAAAFILVCRLLLPPARRCRRTRHIGLCI